MDETTSRAEPASERNDRSRSPVVGRHLLAAELKELRVDAGLTHVDLAQRLGWPQAKVSKIESARQGAGVEAVMAVADICHASDRHRDRLVDLAHAARGRGWWEAYQDVLAPAERTYVGFESEATTVHVFASEEVPEQVRTREYAAAVLAARGVADDEVVRRSLEALERRQRELVAGGVRLELVLTESALRRSVGGAEVLRAQQECLLESAGPGVVLRVLPMGRGALPVSAPFALLSFEADRPPQIAQRPGPVPGELVQSPAEVAAYRDAMNRLVELALGPEESVRWLREEVVGSAAS